MRAIFAVYKREVGLFFRSPIAYAITFGLLLLIGLLFSDNVRQIALINQQGQATYGAEEAFLSNLFFITFLMFIVAPLLTMRLIAEEAREGTLEVLMTLPMGESAFIIGKFFAVWTVYTVILLLTLIHLVMLASYGATLDGGLVAVVYFGAWLYGGAVLSVTLIWSAITEDQIVAAFLGAASVLVLFLADRAAEIAANQPSTAGAADFLRELGLTAHYQNTMLEGILRAEDVAYFILVMIACLFITTLITGTRRWRAS